MFSHVFSCFLMVLDPFHHHFGWQKVWPIPPPLPYGAPVASPPRATTRNCLFRSVADQLCGDANEHQSYRERCCEPMLRTYAGPRGGEVIGFRWVFLGSGNSGNAGNLNGGFSNPLNTFRGFPVLTFFQENQSHEEEITEI